MFLILVLLQYYNHIIIIIITATITITIMTIVVIIVIVVITSNYCWYSHSERIPVLRYDRSLAGRIVAVRRFASSYGCGHVVRQGRGG